MRRSVKSLVGFTMGATDGEVGKVKEFYFDDDSWTIRYLIVNTGNWLLDRIVLISPAALLTPNWDNKVFPINLTKEQIRHSPDIDTQKPVSRQEEIKLLKYYSWISYWSGGNNGGGVGAFEMNPMEVVPVDQSDVLATVDVTHNDKHLRSTHQVTGYHIKATDGEIGEVEDFLLDENTWKIESILIDTGQWFSRKKIVISPTHILEIDWETSTVVIDTTVEDVRNSPEYDSQQEMMVEYTLAHPDDKRASL